MLSQRRDQGDEIRPVYEMGEPSASFFFVCEVRVEIEKIRP